MSVTQRYKEIFTDEIIKKSTGVIFSFSPLQDKYVYHPYSHAVSKDAVEKLGELMRLNLFFYSFGEDELVQYYEKDMFSSMEQAAKYAYKSRLPKRVDITDGLPSEVLLDLLVQMYNTSLWLGQAKLGSKEYCKSDISSDLLKKFNDEYLSKQLFFICDKRVSINDEAKEILEIIEEINIRSMEEDEKTRAHKLLDYFKSANIKIKIPCLLAYGEASVYKDVTQLYQKIEIEVENIKNYFAKHTYIFGGFSPEIVFYVFPIESIERLRNKETGFYAGLC